MTANVMVIVERQFDYPQQVVFRAWTAPKEMAQWRGSPGWHVEADTVTSELRPGGAGHAPAGPRLRLASGGLAGMAPAR